MNRRTIILTMLGFLAVITPASYSASGTFSGRIWNDINRDGIQDMNEPGMTNHPIGVYSDLIVYYGYLSNCVFGIYYTDSDGRYDFSFSNSNGSCTLPYFTNISYNFVVLLGPPLGFGVSPYNVGTNDTIDSDFEWYAGYIVTNDAVNYTSRDLGVYRLNAGLSLDLTVSNAPPGTPLYVTNGTKVTYSYRVVNTGDTYISYLGVVDDENPEFFGEVNCPLSLAYGESITFTTQLVIHASITNMGSASAIPVDPGTCTYLPTFDPVEDSSQAIVIVVTNPLAHVDGDVFPNAWEMQYGFDPLSSNAPNVHSDSDWMSNYEEYLAGTDPTNPSSFFPAITLADSESDTVSMMIGSSTPDRVYGLWRSTDLLADPQSWSLLPPELTGTSAAITFTVTNGLPGAIYRTGVRLP